TPSIEAAHDRTWTEGTSEARNDSLDADVLAAATRLHAVRFYHSRESLARIVGTCLGEGFLAGLPAIVIATPEHRDAIKQALAAHYFDVSRLERANDLIMV